MKNFHTVFLFISLFLFISCQKNEGNAEEKSIIKTASVNELEKQALSKLYAAIKSKNVENVELKEDEINIGKTKVKVSVSTEFDGIRQDSWIFAAKYDTKLIDSSETVFSIGSIGIGKDKKDAVETSTDEWVGLFGIAFAEMLSNSKVLKVENFNVFAGLMGIRGEKPENGWLDGSSEMNKKILTALMPVIKKSNTEITALNLLVTINENGQIEGEGKINNQVSQELLNELKKINWEKNSTGYMFKQFYLLKSLKKNK